MKKVLIQVVSVITLVFGTCYQSVLALADDRQRTELSGVQLSDSQGNKPNQVKVNEKNELEMTITINNKDGDNEKGTVDMWLPESQLKVLQKKVKAESAVPDTKSTLIFEKRRNQQPHLTWRHVDTSATFKLKLPVQFTATMTSTELPIAVDTHQAYLQPLTVVGADTKDEDLAQAGAATGLPADMTQSLASFIEAQKAQQAQQAQQAAQQQEAEKQAEQKPETEAPVKDDNDDQDKVKEDKNTVKEDRKAARAENKLKREAAKQEATEKRQAEKKVEQDAEDKKQKDADDRDTLKKNAPTATAEGKTDGVEREGNDEKETRAGTDLGKMLEDKHGTAASLFNSVSIERNGVTTGISPNEPLDVSNLTDFTVHYNWDSDTLLDKLGDYDVKDGDFYTFRIYGLKEFKGTNEGSLGYEGDEFATWKLTPGKDSKGDYQEIRIEFTNEKMNATNVRYALSLKQEYSGSGPIDFEYNGETTWTVDPTETKSMLKRAVSLLEISRSSGQLISPMILMT